MGDNAQGRGRMERDATHGEGHLCSGILFVKGDQLLEQHVVRVDLVRPVLTCGLLQSARA